MKHTLLTFIFLMLNNLISAQNQPVLAVIPLRSLGGINREDANTVTSLLETGLVKSAMFQVVENRSIADVLAVHIDESVLNEEGRFDASKANLFTYLPLNGQYWTLGKKLR